MAFESGITEEIVSLLRGFFSTPVMSSLGRLGVLNSIIALESFTANDFVEIPNKKLLQDTFNYLSRINLMECVDHQKSAYRASELGKQVFQRASSFYVPHSYYEYMHKYHDKLLDTTVKASQKVERLENVIGSGKTHQRYFPPAISFLKRKTKVDVIVDIGCGDGHFLSNFSKNVPGKEIVGIDLSQIAIDVTYKNLTNQFPSQRITMICSDAFDIKKWSNSLKKVAGDRKIAITMWFLLHEISKNNPEVIKKYLTDVNKLFPASPIVICELVRHPDTLLSKNKSVSFMPEYLFFHEMSGQGILSWDEYHDILKSVPYNIGAERLFDELPNSNCALIPSSFVWCLLPK